MHALLHQLNAEQCETGFCEHNKFCFLVGTEIKEWQVAHFVFSWKSMGTREDTMLAQAHVPSRCVVGTVAELDTRFWEMSDCFLATSIPSDANHFLQSKGQCTAPSCALSSCHCLRTTFLHQHQQPHSCGHHAQSVPQKAQL